MLLSLNSGLNRFRALEKSSVEEVKKDAAKAVYAYAVSPFSSHTASNHPPLWFKCR